MRFCKYHALGNDYLVIEPESAGGGLSDEQIRMICHRNYGVGSDGILFGPVEAENADFGLRIFNPDGSEAEKSGNGLRIFARYLWDAGKVDLGQFGILTVGGKVLARVHEGGGSVTVEMGQVSFDSRRIPVTGPKREVINEKMLIDAEELTFSAASIGNPHCVVLCGEVSEGLTRRLGPGIETGGRFPNRCNVQFMQVLDRGNIRIEIWERGAGYTLASGSSSSAAAAVAKRLGLCDSQITVHMPGGEIAISLTDDYSVTMTGPVQKVADGVISDELFRPPRK